MTPEPQPLQGNTFEPFGLGWRARVENRTIRFTVRRLRHDHGSLRGYMDVEFKPAGARKVSRLAGEQINLSSGRDRSGFANRLLERAPGIDWRNLVDAFCVEVEAREASGPQLVWVGNLPAPIHGGWLIEGLIERNQTTGIYGDGAVGKSWVSLAAAVSVTTGREVLPGYRPTTVCKALYCDYETDEDTLNLRVAQIARGIGIEPPNIGYLRMDSPFSDSVEVLLSLVQEHDIGLVIVDSVEAAMAGSVASGAPSNEGPAKLNRAIRRLGISALLVDHISAEQAQSGNVATKAYGNIFKRNWQRVAFQLQQTKEPAADGLRHLGLVNTKRNNAKLAPPVGMAWDVNDEWCRWWREEIEEPELQVALPTADRIKAYLVREGPSQPSIISEETGLSGVTVRQMLVRRKDLFRKSDRGLWDLVRQHEEHDYDDL